jgi:hypothetical protein
MAAKEFDSPNWKPLEELAGPAVCREFMRMWREQEIEFYKHIGTRRYLLLDLRGRCYRRGPTGLQLADAKSELARVLGRAT